jgi:transcriptional regulator with XRE-family HTH domain
MNVADFKKRIGERIIQLRKEKGWSQAELARNCFKDRQAIERIENGKVNASGFMLYQIAKTLGVSLKDLCDIE